MVGDRGRGRLHPAVGCQKQSQAGRFQCFLQGCRPREVSPGPHLSLLAAAPAGMVVCNWVVILSVCITVLCVFDPTGRTFVKLRATKRRQRNLRTYNLRSVGGEVGGPPRDSLTGRQGWLHAAQTTSQPACEAWALVQGLASPCLSFLVCKVGIIASPASRCHYEIYLR